MIRFFNMHMKRRKPNAIGLGQNQSGFSLVELMVTVGIIGILGSMGLADFQTFQVQAMYGRAEAELNDISGVIQGLRAADDEVLGLITGNFCTFCAGNPPASWANLGYATPPVDPWGSPYQMDENEGEFGPTDCRYDALYSAGKDKIWTGAGGGNDIAGDDIRVEVPLYHSNANCSGSDFRPMTLGPNYSL